MRIRILCRREVGINCHVYNFMQKNENGAKLCKNKMFGCEIWFGNVLDLTLLLCLFLRWFQCESAFFYIDFFSAIIQTVGIMGPIFGFTLGSFCAKLYVDIGAVDLGIHKFNQRRLQTYCCWTDYGSQLYTDLMIVPRLMVRKYGKKIYKT